MLVRFWGVRGSLPTPISGGQVQAKIAAAVSRISPKDIESEESKMKFLSNLPSWIYGTVGGNTACVELKTAAGAEIILDCGSGLKSFSKMAKQPEDLHYHIFLSHYHWDHIQGLPFFSQAFNPNTKIDLYSNFPDSLKYLEVQSSLPYFPQNACWHSIKNQIKFHLLTADEIFELEGIKVNSHEMRHPGKSYAFSFTEENKKFVYSTDTELAQKDFDTENPKNSFFKDADVLVLDSQYTDLEAIEKENWGHSSFSNAIDFAHLWNVKNLYFFHHEPNYDDKKLYTILQSGKIYKKYNREYSVNLFTATEGQEIEI